MQIDGQFGRTLKPGQSDLLSLSFDTINSWNQVRKEVIVKTNDPNNSEVPLTCLAKVEAPFRGPPPRIKFGTIDPTSGPKEKTLTLTWLNKRPIHPKIVKPIPPGLDASIKEAFAGKHYRLNVQAKPPWPNGPIEEKLKVETGVKEMPVVDVRVHAEIPVRVQIKPQVFTFSGKTDRKESTHVRIKWLTKDKHKITRAECSDVKLKAKVSSKQDDQHIILTAPKGYDPPKKAVVVTMHTDDKTLRPLQIPVHFSKAPRQAPAKKEPDCED